MLRIHDLLRDKQKVTCARIALETEMNARTIRRDLEFMRYQLDLPIEYDQKEHTFAYSEPVNGALFGAMAGKGCA